MDELRTLLRRDESYAIHTLINVAENPGTSTAEIAERLQLPPAFTAKVVRKLVNAGLVASRMGRTGGLSLKVDLDELSMLDVIEGVSGKLVLDTCQTKRLCATQQRKGRCNLKLAWLATTLQIRDVLGEVRMSQLCDLPAAA
jgi:Rrf2 family protein